MKPPKLPGKVATEISPKDAKRTLLSPVAAWLQRPGRDKVVRSLKQSREDPIVILKHFEFVDDQWYRHHYPDAARGALRSEVHYVVTGAALGFNPNPLFHTQWYVKTYGHTFKERINPAVHYLTIGSAKGMKPNPLFDPAWYRKTYPDIAASGLEPLEHFLKHGAAEGRNPSQFVHTAWLPKRGDNGTDAPDNSLARYFELIDTLRGQKEN